MTQDDIVAFQTFFLTSRDLQFRFIIPSDMAKPAPLPFPEVPPCEMLIQQGTYRTDACVSLHLAACQSCAVEVLF